MFTSDERTLLDTHVNDLEGILKRDEDVTTKCTVKTWITSQLYIQDSNMLREA